MRLEWDQYFMEIAHVVKKRSTCLRRQVGAVIVKDNRILTTGYNGAASGVIHCLDRGGCPREKLQIPSGQRHELCHAIHAEQNAIIQGALHGVSTAGSKIYVTNQPCVLCAKILVNAGIKELVFEGEYPDEMAMEILKEAGVQIRRLQQG